MSFCPPSCNKLLCPKWTFMLPYFPITPITMIFFSWWCGQAFCFTWWDHCKLQKCWPTKHKLVCHKIVKNVQNFRKKKINFFFKKLLADPQKIGCVFANWELFTFPHVCVFRSFFFFFFFIKKIKFFVFFFMSSSYMVTC